MERKNIFMKKIGLLSFVIAAGLSVNAQDPAMGSSTSTPTLRTPMSVVPRFGIKGGANLANLIVRGDVATNAYETNRKTSFYGGLFVNVPVGGMFRFQPEVLYSSQGAKVVNTFTSGTVTGTDRFEQDLGYIAVPLMVQLQSPGGFFIEAGPQVSYLVTDKRNETAVRPEIDFDRLDVAGAAGLGYLSRVGLGINARYNFGLANIVNDGDSKEGLEMKNSVIQIGLVYQFGANK